MSEQAGRELDARVAEKVMGFKLGDEPVGDEIHEVYRAPNGRGYYHYQIPHYSTSIAAAWEVVEKFEAMQLFRYTTGRYIACLADGNSLHEGEADTAPLAICLAALKAVGAEGEGG